MYVLDSQHQKRPYTRLYMTDLLLWMHCVCSKFVGAGKDYVGLYNDGRLVLKTKLFFLRWRVS